MYYNPVKPYTKKILELISSYRNNKWCMMIGPSIIMNYNFPMIDHTDGIGTKGYYHWMKKTFKNAVIDAFAMNVNDLATLGATPFKLQNHIFLPEDNNEAVYEIVSALADICQKNEIIITGGETSIHDNMQGMDISITMSGISPNTTNYYSRNKYTIGDVLVGIPSSGLHSNGFTMVREVMKDFRDEYVEPTRIYTKELKEVWGLVGVINHITGGAYTKLRSYLPKNADAMLDFEETPPKIFTDLFDAGFTSTTMYKTFNCGYGIVMGVPSNNVDQVVKDVDGKVIGKIVKGSGEVKFKSVFSREWMVLNGY